MDSEKLDEVMKQKGMSTKEMCSLLGMSRTAFYRKRKGISEFTQSEIRRIVDILNVDSPMEIFFAKKVS